MKAPLKESRIKINRGSLRGRFVFFRERPNLRPTRAIVREAVFSMLSPFSSDYGFVDLCAGSGIMGLEAYSIGFSPVLLLDSDPYASRQLAHQIRAFEAPVSVLRMQAQHLARLKLTSKNWVLFADPPYCLTSFHAEMLGVLQSETWFQAGSLYVAESEHAKDPAPAKGFERLKHKKYGRTFISVYRKQGDLAST